MHTRTPYRASTFISGSKIPTSSSIWAGENETLMRAGLFWPADEVNERKYKYDARNNC